MSAEGEIKTMQEKIQGKLKMLEFTAGDTAKVIETGDLKTIERHGSALEHVIDKTHQLKLEVQELRIESGNDPVEVRLWTETLESQISKFEGILKEVEYVAAGIRSIEEEKREEEKRKRNLEEKIQLEKAKHEARASLEKTAKASTEESGNLSSVGAKLPKLEITKFQGTFLDWMRFWNQFETEIDKAKLTQVAKFSYLKELLVPSVRASIDGLPFTTEGYERAKAILKTKYGKPSEVANAHMQCIIGLSTVHGGHPAKIHDFYEKLTSHIQVLETMGKVNEIGGFVRATLDKLPGIRADLVRLDDNWQEWGFAELIESLRKWCDRNPIVSENLKPEPPKPDLRSRYPPNRDPRNRFQARKNPAYQTKDESAKVGRNCIYCNGEDHSSTQCKKVPGLHQRRQILSDKKLCFNCTGTRHQARECHSKYTCQHCGGRHHTSICDRLPSNSQMMLATGEGSVIYPVVVVFVDGIKCRALLDTGAGSSYASAALIERLNKRPTHIEHRQIDMMLCSTVQKVQGYSVTVKSVDGKFEMMTKINKVDKGVLLTVPNPNYGELISKYRHLQGVVMDDDDKKSELPIHVILGASEYSRIKTETKPRIGQPSEPIAEFTMLGWTMMSTGREAALSNVYLTKTSAADYEQLCSLDVLGLADRPEADQQNVFAEFSEQLNRSDEGWYESGLLWKPGHDHLQSNERGSIRRLQGLVRKLQREPGLIDKYDEIIQEQLTEGIVERVVDEPNERVFYIPHKPVKKETAVTTKLRIVFDASAKPSEDSPSLNECLETGPPLQNLLWNVLVRNRLKPVALAADIKQAFLQVRIRPEDRDALRFHWLKNKDPSVIEALRFTRALFGLVQSPFLLAGTLKLHLQSLREKYPVEVDEILRSLYVDDVITGGNTKEEVQDLKKTIISVFGDAKFTMHKWNSNEPQLESENVVPVHEPQLDGGNGVPVDEQQSYAKQQLGVKEGESKILGLPWNKREDTIAVTFPEEPVDNTKRGMLRFLAAVYDPLGVASPTTLVGKLLYREVCDSRLPWDEKLSDRIGQEWLKFVRSLPNKVEVLRSIPRFKEPIEGVQLHVFGDTSGVGTSAAVYAVITQASGVSKGLIAAKSRLAKKNLTIPRLELVSAHMAANLVENVRVALEGYPIKSVHGWSDSTVALHWIKGGGTYKQFVANRVRKINDKDYIEWRHVDSKHNPADIGSRGCKADQLCNVWLPGPQWLSKPEEWPGDVVTEPNKETEAEAKLTKEVFAVAVEARDDFDEVLERHTFWRTIRISAWVMRFLQNCRSKKWNRVSGPLTTAETEIQVKWWIRREQQRHSVTDKFLEDQERLNLQKNDQGIYVCRGRIQGHYPVYLPPRVVLSEKMVQDAHILTLHGGVGLTMAHVRQEYWIPRLRQLAKNVVNHCYGCKKFHVTKLQNPPPGNLPVDRTEGTFPFQVVGVDYAGPITYKISKKKEGKAYILLFACSLTRAVHLELLTDQTTAGFIRCLKHFIARRGRPTKIYSDNGRSFVAASRWLKSVMREEKLQDYLAHHNILWQFNLARAPWWGGQFERLVGVVKQSFYKSMGRAYLTFGELEEVVLEVEVAVNNRPLSYVEDDVELPVLTPNVMMHGLPNLLPEEDAESVEDVELRKRTRYLRRCKDILWSRWTTEYIRSLRERHNLKHKTKVLTLKVGDVVLIQSEERNRGKWNIGVVVKLIKGRDGVVRAARLRAGKSYLERAIQQLCPMELSCDVRDTQLRNSVQLNPRAREFAPRRAAVAAAKRIREIAEQENK